MRLSTSKTSAAEDKLVDLSRELHAHGFNIVDQLFERIWSGSGALSMAPVVER